jgi:hypothetical protein
LPVSTGAASAGAHVSDATGTWTPGELSPGQALRQPTPLFKKLDESVVEEEYARLEG